MKYYATKKTPEEVTIQDIKFVPGVEVQVDNVLYCFLGRDHKNFDTCMKNDLGETVETTGDGGPISKADVGSAIKPAKRK